MIYKLYNADSKDILAKLDENSIDSLITDPPAGISFMGKDWDDYGSLDNFQLEMREIFKEVYRVLKPGAHGLVWAIPRTSHHTTMALEKCGEGCSVKLLNEQSGVSKSPKTYTRKSCGMNCNSYGKGMGEQSGAQSINFDDQGGASRFFKTFRPEVDESYTSFFYCAKASTRERNEGVKEIKNNHPTLKSIKLMSYLITLITPPNGKVLDCFMGSGSTGCACAQLGFDFIGIEKEKDYFDIAEKRIEYWKNKGNK